MPEILPFISIVVPAYNEQKCIGRCIEALLKQDYPLERREIIVVDNNSTDSTPQIVTGYSGVTLLFEREIVGPAAGRNRGIQHANGEIVAFTDADCVPEPNWLTHLIAPLANPEVVGTVGIVQPLAESGLISEFVADLNPIGSHEIDRLWYIVTANAAFRRQALLDVGLFNPRLFTGEDVDLGLRLQFGQYGRIEGAPDAVIRHPFPNTWQELSERFRRYGYSEILLDTLFHDNPNFMRSPQQQLRQMLRQFGALFTYLASFLVRSVRSIFQHHERRYLAWPLLWLAAEGSSLIGKLYGLFKTRFFRRIPPKHKQKTIPHTNHANRPVS